MDLSYSNASYVHCTCQCLKVYAAAHEYQDSRKNTFYRGHKPVTSVFVGHISDKTFTLR